MAYMLNVLIIKYTRLPIEKLFYINRAYVNTEDVLNTVIMTMYMS